MQKRKREKVKHVFGFQAEMSAQRHVAPTMESGSMARGRPYYGYGSHLGSASVSRSQVDRGSFYRTGRAAYNYGFNIRGSVDASYGYGSLLGSTSVTRSQVDRGSFYGTGHAAYQYSFNIHGKRSAEPFYGYGTGVSHQVVSRPFSQY